MKSLFCDRAFLRGISGFERALAKVLSVTLTVVLVVATLQLLIFLGSDLLDLQVNWTGEGLVSLLDQVLVILIALEVLQNLTAYLREHVIQIELVLVTALTAVSRVIECDPSVIDALNTVRDIYVEGFKNGNDEKVMEFYAQSVAQFCVLGKERLEKWLDFVAENLHHVFGDFFLAAGRRYIMGYLAALEQ